MYGFYCCYFCLFVCLFVFVFVCFIVVMCVGIYVYVLICSLGISRYKINYEHGGTEWVRLGYLRLRCVFVVFSGCGHMLHRASAMCPAGRLPSVGLSFRSSDLPTTILKRRDCTCIAMRAHALVKTFFSQSLPSLFPSLRLSFVLMRSFMRLKSPGSIFLLQ